MTGLEDVFPSERLSKARTLIQAIPGVKVLSLHEVDNRLVCHVDVSGVHPDRRQDVYGVVSEIEGWCESLPNWME